MALMGVIMSFGMELVGSLSMFDVLFMLVIRPVAVGWQLYVALLVGVVLFRMYFVGSLSVFDVLFMVVIRAVAVGWQV